MIFFFFLAIQQIMTRDEDLPNARKIILKLRVPTSLYAKMVTTQMQENHVTVQNAKLHPMLERMQKYKVFFFFWVQCDKIRQHKMRSS